MVRRLVQLLMDVQKVLLLLQVLTRCTDAIRMVLSLL